MKFFEELKESNPMQLTRAALHYRTMDQPAVWSYYCMLKIDTIAETEMGSVELHTRKLNTYLVE